MSHLTLLRHGQSIWNKRNLFTGWVDIPLSLEGIEEALAAGEKMKNMCFDEIYTSLLIRSIQTAMIAMSKTECDGMPVIQYSDGRMRQWATINNEFDIIPVYRIEELNERYYGELQGKNKKQMAEEYGEEQVHIWRRSYATQPPGGESLKDNYTRTIPFFKETILKKLNEGKNILISAHGNSLRAIVKYIENISDKDIPNFEIPTGVPIVYDFENETFTNKRVL
jgi:2,3-bisphosphoglycerate-dependent phosphoglycerate mutase